MEVIGNEGKEFTTRDLAKISKMLKDEVPSKVMEQMVDLSRQARDNSYSPYSKFRVGCCLLTENGEFILGTNVENLSYGLTVCAERTAICNSVTRGERNLLAAFIATDMEFYVSPCGACRQTLHEFGVKHLFLLTNSNKIQYFSTQFLLPSAVVIPHLKDVTKGPVTIKSKKKAQINGKTKSNGVRNNTKKQNKK